MNNSFAQCIDKICGHEIASLASYKCSLFGGNTVVVEGHKGICNYSTEKITFKIAKGCLVVVGNSLQLKCLDKHFAVVVGQVLGIGVEQ